MHEQKLKHFETISAPTKIKHPSTPHIQMSFYFSDLFFIFFPNGKTKTTWRPMLCCVQVNKYIHPLLHIHLNTTAGPTCSLSPFLFKPRLPDWEHLFLRSVSFGSGLKPHESSVRHVQHIHFLQFAAYSCQSCHYIATTEMSSCYSKLASWYVELISDNRSFVPPPPSQHETFPFVKKKKSTRWIAIKY